MTAVALDYAQWSARYPELAATVPPATAAAYWAEAGLYCDNSDTSPIRDDSPGGERSLLLGMVTAHIAALAAAPLVGRIASATQGSVTVQTDLGVPGSAAWFAQTRYGLAFWQATAKYRMAHYFAPVSQRRRW